MNKVTVINHKNKFVVESREVAKMTYTVQEVSKILGVSTKSIYELIKSEKLKHCRIGKAIRIPKQYILDFMGV